MAGFDADAAAEKVIVDYPPFPFTWRGETYDLPNLSVLTTNEAVELSDAMQAASSSSNEDADAFFKLLDLLDRLVGEEAASALRDMPAAVMAQVLQAWESSAMEDMGELGKEDTPLSPRNRQERRSQKTSRPKAKTSGRSPSTKSAATSAAS